MAQPTRQQKQVKLFSDSVKYFPFCTRILSNKRSVIVPYTRTETESNECSSLLGVRYKIDKFNIIAFDSVYNRLYGRYFSVNKDAFKKYMLDVASDDGNTGLQRVLRKSTEPFMTPVELFKPLPGTGTEFTEDIYKMYTKSRIMTSEFSQVDQSKTEVVGVFRTMSNAHLKYPFTIKDDKEVFMQNPKLNFNIDMSYHDWRKTLHDYMSPVANFLHGFEQANETLTTGKGARGARLYASDMLGVKLPLTYKFKESVCNIYNPDYFCEDVTEHELRCAQEEARNVSFKYWNVTPGSFIRDEAQEYLTPYIGSVSLPVKVEFYAKKDMSNPETFIDPSTEMLNAAGLDAKQVVDTQIEKLIRFFSYIHPNYATENPYIGFNETVYQTSNSLIEPQDALVNVSCYLFVPKSDATDGKNKNFTVPFMRVRDLFFIIKNFKHISIGTKINILHHKSGVTVSNVLQCIGIDATTYSVNGVTNLEEEEDMEDFSDDEQEEKESDFQDEEDFDEDF